MNHFARQALVVTTTALSLSLAVTLSAGPSHAQTPPPATAPVPGPAATPPDSAGAGKDDGIPEALDPNRFRFSSAGVTQSMTTNTVGVGRDNIGGEADFVGFDFYFSPQYWFYDEKDDKLFVNAQVGASVEMTDSGTTTTKREPQFNDLQLGLGYNRSIYTSDDKAWLTRLLVRTRGIFPTSPVSSAQGRYLTTSLNLGVLQTVDLLGSDAAGLNSLTLVGGVTWSHLFARSYTPTNSGLERVRQSAGGRTIVSDQLTFNSMDTDRIVPSIFASLPLYENLSFNTTWRLLGRFRHDFEGTGCDVVVQGECVEVERYDERATYLSNSSIDFALSYGIFDVAYFTFGYLNETLTLGEDGRNRNVFYSPDAQFYVDLSFQLSEIYKKAAQPGGEANNPFVQAKGPLGGGISF